MRQILFVSRDTGETRSFSEEIGSMKKLFHASVEGGQHSAKGLDGFLKFAWKAGADGCQPSNFMLDHPDGGFYSAKTIRQKFADAGIGLGMNDLNGSQIGLQLDGISAHCPFWVHTTAWTGSKTMRPFLPARLHNSSPAEIEQWAEGYILSLLDLCDELKVHVIPMFWGLAYGSEVAGGYPWGFWSGPGYDLIKEGNERFVEKTARIRKAANDRDIVLAHEIHPGTAAQCANDFNHLRRICDYDSCLAVNADLSHCWDGESWQDRFDLVDDAVFGCHMKNHHVRPGKSLRCMESDWKERPMQFTDLERGDLNLLRYVEQMIRIGYHSNYLDVMKNHTTAPLVVEAEGAYENLDAISARGIRFVKEHCCFEMAEGSFEDGMGADKK